MPMLEVGTSEQPLMISILPLVDLSGLPTIMATMVGLFSSTLPSPPLMLAIIMVGQLVDHLMKGAMVAMGKRKLVALVPLPLAELAKPLVKVTSGLIEGLFPKSCPDKEQLGKQFWSN